MRVEPGRKSENLARAGRLIIEAAAGGADLVLLPEALTLGWMDPSARVLADEIPDGESCGALREHARKAGVHVCAGMVEREGEKIFNAAVLINPEGEVLARHRKINELEIAHSLYSAGHRLQTVETELGRIGLMICADAFIPGQVISRSLAAMGAELILSPCAWAVPPDHDNSRDPYGRLWLESYAPVAREHQVWIAGASSVGPIQHGPWSGWNCVGCSLLVGPEGEKMMQGPYGREAETILHAEIVPRAAGRPCGEL